MYTVKVIKQIDNGKGFWPYFDIGIFKDGEIVGQYRRNYGSIPFAPFTVDGYDYALYSMDYTATRMMSLPKCIDLGGENPNAFGFCPVELYVPEKANGKFGFVCGCIWGLDSGGWYLEYIDLSNLKGGEALKRIDKYQGLQIPDVSLKDYVDENFDILSKENITEDDIKQLPRFQWDDED